MSATTTSKPVVREAMVLEGDALRHEGAERYRCGVDDIRVGLVAPWG